MNVIYLLDENDPTHFLQMETVVNNHLMIYVDKEIILSFRSRFKYPTESRFLEFL